MIRRTHRSGEILSEALYSDCGAYRYRLSRHWGDGPGWLFVMLNPSTASELANDPTIARCEARARRMGAPGLAVVNLFALRSPYPRALSVAEDPVGPENDRILSDAARQAGAVLCAWGNHGGLLNRAARVLALLRASGRPLYHLGLTQQGQPFHPLYRAMDLAPTPWDQAASNRMS
ncbi:DUF1643 domain-containing protein [Neotabrizicola sp. VNH66]|uniref:DUF1643 domain-containing protein n=1 Tax=Neotabrizicola sp. VNH66 TaxID=3400918 RepID=UPI003C042A82